MTLRSNGHNPELRTGLIFDLGGRLENAIKRRFFWLLTLLSVCTLGLLYWQFTEAQAEIIERTALQHADVYSAALAAFRTLYTSEVVETAKRHGLTVSHDYRDHDDAIPLPATLSMELGKILGEQGSGGEAHLYSPYPFPWRRATGGLKDNFARDAWAALSKDATRPFYRIENGGNHRVLRYATADLMRSACVGCHNTHPDTPRRGWHEGDLRGILEITYPIAHASDLAERGARSTALIAAPFLLTAALALGIVSLRQSKKRTRELGDANQRLATEMKERQEMENELRLAQKLEAIGHLAAGIAHEVNTPMQYIGDNTHFLETAFGNMLDVIDSYQVVVDSAGNDESNLPVENARAVAESAKLEFLRKRVPRALETTIEGVDSVSRIVRAMKNFSHGGTDEKTPTDLNKAIEDTITISRSEWKYVATVETDLDSFLPLVPCLIGELNQVVLIVLVNAAQAVEEAVDRSTGEKGRIAIRTRQVDGTVEISIADTGGGVPESIQDKIFDPFFTTKEVGRGSGQGLAIARTIVVDKHAGSLTFEVEPGKGTTFHIRIPLAESDPAAGDGT